MIRVDSERAEEARVPVPRAAGVRVVDLADVDAAVHRGVDDARYARDFGSEQAVVHRGVVQEEAEVARDPGEGRVERRPRGGVERDREQDAEDRGHGPPAVPQDIRPSVGREADGVPSPLKTVSAISALGL